MSTTLEDAETQAETKVDEAIRMRDRARELLARLLRDRDMLENALSGTGRCDHLKQVTGRSTLDNAIASTQRVIEAIDRAITGMDSRTVGRFGARAERSAWSMPVAAARQAAPRYRGSSSHLEE